VVLSCEQVRHSLLNVGGLTEVRARLEGVPAKPAWGSSRAEELFEVAETVGAS
jgi:hypothetical protein